MVFKKITNFGHENRCNYTILFFTPPICTLKKNTVNGGQSTQFHRAKLWIGYTILAHIDCNTQHTLQCSRQVGCHLMPPKSTIFLSIVSDSTIF